MQSMAARSDGNVVNRVAWEGRGPPAPAKDMYVDSIGRASRQGVRSVSKRKAAGNQHCPMATVVILPTCKCPLRWLLDGLRKVHKMQRVPSLRTQRRGCPQSPLDGYLMARARCTRCSVCPAYVRGGEAAHGVGSSLSSSAARQSLGKSLSF